MSAPLQQHHFVQPEDAEHTPPPPHQVVTQQQQQPTTAGNNIDLAQYGLSTLYCPDKKTLDKTEVKQMEFKYNILSSCLKADEWEAVNINLNDPAIFVSPGTDYNNLEDLVEGIKYVNPYNYGHHKSSETLNRLNELYYRYVLGTDMGRRLIQRYLPSLISSLSPPPPPKVNKPPPKVNKEHKKLAARTLNFMLRELSTTDQTPQQQNEKVLVNTPQQNEKLLVTVEFLLGQLKINQEILLREEKKKRQLDSVVSIQQQRDKKRLKRVEDDDNVDESQDKHTHDNNAITITPPPPTSVLSSKPLPDDATNNVTVKPPAAEQSQTSMPTKTDDVVVVVPKSDLVPYKEEDACEDDEEVEDAAIVATTNGAAAATTTNQQPNPSPTNNNLSNQPLPDYELANNDDELELTFSTQAEKMRHLAILKLKRLALAMKQKESMKTKDETAHLTQFIGDNYRAGYDNVTNEIKKAIANKFSQLPILAKESTPTSEEIELESICNTTAQDIRSECPGYTGELLLSEAEIHLLARVSKGTEGHNNGESQEVSMLAVANRLKNENRFGLPVVLHQKIMKGLGYYRHFPEKCDAIMETIKAIHYSKYKRVIIMINDTLRAFYESVHYCYFLGVVKALNPNRKIEIISCANGLVPTIGLPYIIEAIHTREEEHQVTRSEVSRVSAGSNVSFDSEESRKYQQEIITEGKELWDMWKKEGALPSFITKGRKRVVEELPYDPEIRKVFRDTIKELEDKLRKLNQKEPSLHNISITSDGSIIDGGSTDVFGPESEIGSNDIAVVLRTSRKSNKVGGDEGGDEDEEDGNTDEDDEADDIAAGIIKDDTGNVFIDNLPIGQLAPIIAHIKKLKLLDNGARLWIFFDHGCARTGLCNKEFSKLLNKLQKRQFRYVFMSTLNRINWNSVAVQTFLGAQKVSPGLEIHCSLEHGKKKITIAGNEHHRIMEKQESNDKCKASVTRIEQFFLKDSDITITLHNDVKVTSGYYLTKKFRKQVEDINSRTTYPPSSFIIPFSTVDAQVQKHLEILNETIQAEVAAKLELERSVIVWSALQRSQLHDSIIVLTGEAAISANSGTSKPKEEDAIVYLSQVKVEVLSNVYEEFLDELNHCRQQDTKGLINRIRWLFLRDEISSDSYVKLMLGFNIFLPDHYKICVAAEAARV